jgi:thioredoxin 1
MAYSVDDSSFEAEVLKAPEDKMVLIDFWAPWCGPCKMLTPIIEQLAAELKDLRVVKMNIDDNPEAPSRYGVRSIPTLMIFKNGKLLDSKVGVLSKEKLIEWVNKHNN